MLLSLNRPTQWIAALPAALALAACSDTQEPNDHGEPEAVEIRDGTTVLVTATASAVTGSITVQVGQATPNYDFVFVDGDGDVITFDQDFHLEVSVVDETIAGFHHTSPGAFRGHFDGETAGSTTMDVRLMHGQLGSAHPDWISTAITITVAQ